MKNIVSLCVIILGVSEGALIKTSPSAATGATMWLAKGKCPGQLDPSGIVAPILLADPFLFMGMPSKPLDPKYLTEDKMLTEPARNFFCNVSVWAAQFKLTKAFTIAGGAWVFQSSLPWNLCGQGFRTGPWKGERSLYMKTMEAMGPKGITLFFW